jgi:hypothetical protein
MPDSIRAKFVSFYLNIGNLLERNSGKNVVELG